MHPIKSPKKLIEVALPLDDINAAAAREKSIRHGHPSTLHLWWARRPLAAARAVLFAQLVNDPGYQRELGYGVNKKEAEAKREKLFQIIRELVQWENTNNEEVLNRAREAIWQSWRETCHLNRHHPQAAELFNPDKLPAFHDPFAGGGAIPLEAQRLGLESYASDLNPVAVMINKAMIEIPPRFKDKAPIGPEVDSQANLVNEWSGAKGLAEDIRRYGALLSQKAYEKIGQYYPPVELPDSFGGGSATVLAWLWARTVASPNPAAQGKHVPLVSSFWLCKKKGKEVYVEPSVDGLDYRFEVKRGVPSNPEAVGSGTKMARGANFQCLVTGAPISADYVKAEGKAGRMGWKLMAIVAEGNKGRAYANGTPEHEELALSASPSWRPEFPLSTHPQYMSVTNYGPSVVADLFMPRQTLALVTFSECLHELHEIVKTDAMQAGWPDDGVSLEDGGKGASAYADAIMAYLGLGISRLANRQSTNSFWHTARETVEQVFARHALPMVWDTAEGNPFSTSSGNFLGQLDYLAKAVANLPAHTNGGAAFQQDAQSADYESRVVSTDPPYYDNVPYADLSDFFYVWLRYSLKRYLPNAFRTLLVPKGEELVADHKRHNGRETAEQFFMQGMTAVMHNIATQSHPAFPVSIYYAFRQAETNDAGTASTGWETFLEAVINAGFAITGTWPVRTELIGNLKKKWNALASSIVLVCEKRNSGAGSISRRDFQRQLREEMPEALETMIGGESGQTPIAPVDLAQSAIGPGMAIFSKYEAVLNQDGSKMSVHDALVLINRAITEYLSPESGSFDADTQFCASWFDQHGWSAGPFGEADTLSRAKGTSVDGVREAGVVESGGGKVRLLKWSEYEADWDPTRDQRTPIWEACHQMIRRLNNQGESAAGELLAKMPEKGESIRQLAYHLYTLCERKKWAEEARAYNELIGSWHAIVAASHEVGHAGEQHGLDF
jgi:putative DNA methylase